MYTLRKYLELRDEVCNTGEFQGKGDTHAKIKPLAPGCGAIMGVGRADTVIMVPPPIGVMIMRITVGVGCCI